MTKAAVDTSMVTTPMAKVGVMLQCGLAALSASSARMAFCRGKAMMPSDPSSPSRKARSSSIDLDLISATVKCLNSGISGIWNSGGRRFSWKFAHMSL